MQAIIVNGTADEIAALAKEMQERQMVDSDTLCYLADRKEAMEEVQRHLNVSQEREEL